MPALLSKYDPGASDDEDNTTVRMKLGRTDGHATTATIISVPILGGVALGEFLSMSVKFAISCFAGSNF